MTDTNSAIQQGWLVSTKSIQMKSLIAFADALGYEYYGSWYGFDNGDKFIKRDFEGFHTCKIISVNTFVKLHNTHWVHSSRKENHLFPYPGGVHAATLGQPLRLDSSSPFHVDAYTLNKAQSAKICEQVYLNGGKNGVSCYRQQVKFTNPDYEVLFLDPLIEERAEKIANEFMNKWFPE